jgi:hypothetical protein
MRCCRKPSEKLKKLDDRATMCYFVGYKYGGGGYRVWDELLLSSGM